MPSDRRPPSPALEIHLLGRLDFETCLALQQRLVYEISGRDDNQAVLLMAEHPPLLCMGRRGSQSQIGVHARELASRQLSIRWSNHGGACQPYGPGIVSIYPIVPLARREWTVLRYVEALHGAIGDSLTELGRLAEPGAKPPQPADKADDIAVDATAVGPTAVDVAGEAAGKPVRGADLRTAAIPPFAGVWGRTGLLAYLGVAVKSGVTYFGAHVSVSPALASFRGIQVDPWRRAPLSSLVAERQRSIRMAAVRESLMRHLALRFEYSRQHVFHGHPYLPRLTSPRDASTPVT